MDEQKEIHYTLKRSGLNRWCIELSALEDVLYRPHIEIDGYDAFLFCNRDQVFFLRDLPDYVIEDLHKQGHVLVREQVSNRENSSIAPWGLKKEDFGRFYDVPVYPRSSNLSSIKDSFNISELAS